jgi:hypothetical protein
MYMQHDTHFVSLHKPTQFDMLQYPLHGELNVSLEASFVLSTLIEIFNYIYIRCLNGSRHYNLTVQVCINLVVRDRTVDCMIRTW